jgi:hypothetical protein
MNNFIKRLSGSVVVLFALLMFMLIGFLGFAVDTGYIYMTRAQAQNVADASALACLINNDANTCGILPHNPPYIFANTLPGILAVNTNGVLFKLDTTYPVNCPNAVTQYDCAEAFVTATIKPFFMTFLDSVPISVSAKAAHFRGAPSCLSTVDSFLINGYNSATLTNCSAVIGGSFSSTNSSGIKIIGVGSTTVFNTSIAPDCNLNSPCPIANPSAFPTQKTYPVPSNLSTSLTNTSCASTGVCTAGIYTSLVTLTRTTNFGTGTYYFEQGLDTNDQIVTNTSETNASGITGVSLYVAAGKTLVLTGIVTLNAPALVDCVASSGIVISQPLESSFTTTKLHGEKNKLTLTGVVNLPGVNLENDGTSSNLSITGSLLVNSLTLKGNMEPNVSPNQCYNLYNNSKIILVR